MIDTNVALHQLDFLEHAAVHDVIVTKTVLEEVRGGAGLGRGVAREAVAKGRWQGVPHMGRSWLMALCCVTGVRGAWGWSTGRGWQVAFAQCAQGAKRPLMILQNNPFLEAEVPCGPMLRTVQT